MQKMYKANSKKRQSVERDDYESHSGKCKAVTIENAGWIGYPAYNGPD